METTAEDKRCPNHPTDTEAPRRATVLVGARLYCPTCAAFLLSPPTRPKVTA